MQIVALYLQLVEQINILIKKLDPDIEGIYGMGFLPLIKKVIHKIKTNNFKTMKKVIIIFIVLGSFAGVNVKAQIGSVSSDSTKVNSENYNKENASHQTVISSEQQPDLIKIRNSELPAMITQTLESSDYKGWRVANSYRTVDNDQYKIEVKKGTASQTYWFDKNGNKIDPGKQLNPSESTKQPGKDNSMPSGTPTPSQPDQK